MKSVLISIQPKWCELIASGKKTVEVRKTRPKIDVPFRCYIYCTKSKAKFVHGGIVETLDDLYRMPNGEIKFGYSGELMCCDEEYGADNFLNGKVMGEFVCDRIENCLDINIDVTCLTVPEWLKYTKGHKGNVWGWHISDLVIYNKPKELSEFHRECEESECDDCPYLDFENTPNSYEGWCIYDERIPLTRPPQSWCYVDSIE